MPEHTQAALGRVSRAVALRRAAAAGGTAVAAGALVAGLADRAASQSSAQRDAEILNLVLLLEQVQAGLYERALADAGLRGELREFAETAREHEQEHIRALREALGSDAREAPTLDFGDAAREVRAFRRTAVRLEDLGVAAYNAGAPSLSEDALVAAARIVSVEARHAAWIRDLAGLNPAPDASEPQRSARSIADALDRYTR